MEAIYTTISIDVAAEEKEYRFDSFPDLKQNYRFEQGVTEFSMRMLLVYIPSTQVDRRYL